MPFYAVVSGRKPGIYESWGDAEEQVRGFSGAVVKRFPIKRAAEAFLRDGRQRSSSPPPARANSTSYGNSSSGGGGSSSSDASSPNSPYSVLFRAPGESVPHPSSCFVLQFDGGSRGNPGVGGAGSLLFAPTSGSSIGRDCVFQGGIYSSAMVTNNAMEYSGLLLGLRAARYLGVRRLLVEGDSQLIIRQLEGSYAVRSANLEAHFAEAIGLIKGGGFDYVGARHLMREHNSLADAVANRAMDQRSTSADFFDAAIARHAWDLPRDSPRAEGAVFGVSDLTNQVTRAAVQERQGRGAGDARASSSDRYRRPRPMRRRGGGGGGR